MKEPKAKKPQVGECDPLVSEFPLKWRAYLDAKRKERIKLEMDKIKHHFSFFYKPDLADNQLEPKKPSSKK